MTIDNVIPLHESGHSVRIPGELPLTEEMRAVPITRAEKEVLEMLGLRLNDIGATTTSLLMLNIVARWSVAA